MVDRAADDLLKELISNTPAWDGQAGKIENHWCDSCLGVDPVVEREGILVFVNTNGSIAAFRGDDVVAQDVVIQCPVCGMPLCDETQLD